MGAADCFNLGVGSFTQRHYSEYLTYLKVDRKQAFTLRDVLSHFQQH